MNKKEINQILEEEIRKVVKEQLFNMPGVKWGKRRSPYQADQRGGDLESMSQEIEAADAASDLNKGQRKAYNAAVASSAEDAKKQVDALRAELTTKFRESISAAIEDAVDRIIDPEIDDMRSQFSDTFQLIFKEMQREFAKAQQELEARMENIAAQYLMKRDAPNVAKRTFKKMQGMN